MLNEKLVKQLSAGEIVLYFNTGDLHLLREVLKASFPESRNDEASGKFKFYHRYDLHKTDWNCGNVVSDNYKNAPLIQISDFLLPEPKFKVGDWVRLSSGLKKEYKVLSFEFDDDVQLYFYKLSGCELMEAEIELIPGNINESTTKCGSENQFEMGKEYEIKYNTIDQEWIKGKLLAIVDHDTHKYVVTTEYIPYPAGCAIIRYIQPKEIKVERWINMSQSGNQVGKKCFESEIEACQHAPQSQKVFQVKLTGTYTI